MIYSYQSTAGTLGHTNALSWGNYAPQSAGAEEGRSIPRAACRTCWRLLNHCLGRHLSVCSSAWESTWPGTRGSLVQIQPRRPSFTLQNMLQVYRQHRQRRRRQWRAA